MIDWGTSLEDLVTLGLPTRPWDRAKVTPGHEIFGFYDVGNFEPEGWKPEYPNPAFSRMTERDGAWMARVLAGFTPAAIRALAEMGQFTDPRDTDHLERVLEGRLQKILARYLTRRSPLSKLHVRDGELCAIDLAELRAGRRVSVRARHDGRTLEVTRRGEERCAPIPRAPYARLTLEDGVAERPLVAHLANGALVGVER